MKVLKHVDILAEKAANAESVVISSSIRVRLREMSDYKKRSYTSQSCRSQHREGNAQRDKARKTTLPYPDILRSALGHRYGRKPWCAGGNALKYSVQDTSRLSLQRLTAVFGRTYNRSRKWTWTGHQQIPSNGVGWLTGMPVGVR